MADTAMVEDRLALVRRAFFLEYVTLAWMTVEAGVAIISGIAAHSITLLAFGVDSLIELASACVLIWRLTVELRHGQSFAESAERRQAVSAEHSCLLSRPISWGQSDGAFGRNKGKSFRGLVCLSAPRPCRSCGFWRGASCTSPTRLVAAHCAPTP